MGQEANNFSEGHALFHSSAAPQHPRNNLQQNVARLGADSEGEFGRAVGEAGGGLLGTPVLMES